MLILEELNKVNSLDFDIDLGFSITEFMSSYRKRFHTSTYSKININMFYTREELQLFETFYVETLEYGTLQFEADFLNEGVLKTYEIVTDPVISDIEANLFNVKLVVIERETIANQYCLTLNSCLSNMLNNLNDINTSLSNNVWAQTDKKQLATCLLNHFNMTTVDINCYRDIPLVTDQDII